MTDNSMIFQDELYDFKNQFSKSEQRQILAFFKSWENFIKFDEDWNKTRRETAHNLNHCKVKTKSDRYIKWDAKNHKLM